MSNFLERPARLPGVAATNSGFVTDFAATLKGIDAHRPIISGTTASDIMGVFTAELLPVLSGLARGFAVCDHWFSSVPTETFPNRAFLCAATSQGHMDDSTSKYTSQSIFGLLSTHNIAWSIYGYNNPPLTRLNFPDTTDAAESHFGVFRDFQAAAAAGSLGAYTFLEPSWGSSGNSQHPNYDVSLGEQLIYDVYYALRNGPAWNQTLLIITYDEHGGCYDHVPPPTGAVPPDTFADEFGFDFTRFGVRVPAVLVSPLIAPGTVFRPSGTVPLDHTSILKTVETRWGLPPLTARDAAAPDVGEVLTLAQPRTDDPLAGVTVPASRIANPVAGTPSHIQQIYRPTGLHTAGQRHPGADPPRDARTDNRAGLPRLHQVAFRGVDSWPGPPHRRSLPSPRASLIGDRDDCSLAGQRRAPGADLRHSPRRKARRSADPDSGTRARLRDRLHRQPKHPLTAAARMATLRRPGGALRARARTTTGRPEHPCDLALTRLWESGQDAGTPDLPDAFKA